jgi:hypothetical protein
MQIDVMKIIRNILVIFLIINAAILITGFLLPSGYTVSRETTINRSKSEIFDYIKLLKNQHEYSVWWKMDPNQITTYTGEDGQVGFSAAWKSELESVGAGEEEIIGIQENERMDFEVRFHEPFESKAISTMKLTAIDSLSTQVTWTFNGDMTYPFNAVLLFMSMDKILGEDLQTGLNNLKAILESQPATSMKKLPNWQWSEEGWRWTQLRLKGEGC